ncbi:MAG: hypothetical protein HND47_12385 [Chloroflexi bacterium]|nr:hypothetical protein [Chloroflexota bacterium]
MHNAQTPDTHRPRRIVSIFTGNAIQFTGIVLGSLLLWISIQPGSAGVRISAMIGGYLLIYFNSHSLLHYSIGKLTGINFKHYSIGGSSHASSYPPGVRNLFERLPFFSAHTDPSSMKNAHQYAKALMFAAGITGTVVLCTVASFIVYHADAPGGSALLIFNMIWQASSLVAEM